MNDPAKISEIRYDLEELSLHGLATGREVDPILLCLHGWLDNAASFVPLMNNLTGYRVIAIDWPGHGYSSHKSADAHYHFIDYVYDLLLLVEANQWQSVNIVAHSMGGMIASAFAAAFPEKVQRLTLIDSIGFISAKTEQTTEQLRNGMLSRLKFKDKRKPVHIDVESAIKARRSVSDLTYDDAKLLVERGLASKDGGLTWRADSRLRNTSPYRLSFKQAEQFIKDIKVPVQLIYGDKGIELVQQGIGHYGPMFEQLSVHKLKGGHHIHMEKPEQSAKLVHSFVQKSS